jgi:RimJ/RimL family protein N-acetyltransferase
MTETPRCEFWTPDACEGSAHCPPRCPAFVDATGVRWVVRPVRDGDRVDLLAMYRDFSPDERAQGLPPRADYRIEQWVDTLLAEGCNFVARRGDVVAGHAVYTPCDDPVPELAVFVHQDYQGRRLGTELCKHVVATAATGGREALVLEVKPANRVAIRLYEKLGFQRTGEAPAGDGIRGNGSFQMRLDLTTAAAMDVQHPPAVRAD